jgi:hypothetical protein
MGDYRYTYIAGAPDQRGDQEQRPAAAVEGVRARRLSGLRQPESAGQCVGRDRGTLKPNARALTLVP